MYHSSYSAFRPFNCVCLTTLINKGLTKVTLITILLYMKLFIISLSIALFFNMLCNESLIGHFSLFYIQVMILFVIEEVRLRFDERFNTWYSSTEFDEQVKLSHILVECPRLNYLLRDLHELGSILSDSKDKSYSFVDLGLNWIVARGYNRNRIAELEEDMPRILAYLRNVQTSKAIEAL